MSYLQGLRLVITGVEYDREVGDIRAKVTVADIPEVDLHDPSKANNLQKVASLMLGTSLVPETKEQMSDRVQAPEVRPAPDEHDAERAQALGENYRSARDLRAAAGAGGSAVHQCPFCTGTYSLIERLGVHIANTHFRSHEPVPGQVGVPLPSRPKPRCSRCGEAVESIEELATHLAYIHGDNRTPSEPPC